MQTTQQPIPESAAPTAIPVFGPLPAPAPAPALCAVQGCGAPLDSAVPFCVGCWARLPESFRHQFAFYLGFGQPRIPGVTRQLAEMQENGARRLAAELAGPLTQEEERQADELTRSVTVFQSFAELLGAGPSYSPKIDCGSRWEPHELQRQRNMTLADFYDRAQAARGDARRATRNGIAGL